MESFRSDVNNCAVLAECSEVSPPSRGKGADDFRKAVVYLKEYSDEPAFRNKLAVCEEEYNAMERKLEGTHLLRIWGCGGISWLWWD